VRVPTTSRALWPRPQGMERGGAATAWHDDEARQLAEAGVVGRGSLADVAAQGPSGWETAALG
jgi:hypothetical protein